MTEIGLTTMAIRDNLWLEQFEQQAGIAVDHRSIPWQGAWREIMVIALYQRGPDVSEVGNTWLAHLEDMHVLRPWEDAELDALGGRGAFLASAWHDGYFARRPISIPWTLDTRAVFYRRDLLAQAGIDEETAFLTPEAMFDTLYRLRAAGHSYPLGIATNDILIHNLSSWVWDRGGDFRSPDGHRITLLEPEARQGVINFFRLHEFIPPQVRMKGHLDCEELFYRGEIPVLFSGQWNLGVVRYETGRAVPAVVENLGVAMPPGTSAYLGGSHLVIWRHSLYDDEAQELISFFNSEAYLAFLMTRGFFPARLSLLRNAPLAQDPLYRTLVNCVMRGRSIKAGHRWAAVEVRINEFVLKLFADLFANPQLNIDREVDYRLRSLSEKVERTILSSW